MSRNVVITGANRGIGLAFCKHYLNTGDRVFALCRGEAKALADTDANVIPGIDVTNPESLRVALAQLKPDPIDILINNAGILKSDTFGDLNFENINAQIQVNTIGPLRVTETLLPLLKPGSKVALITSRMGSIADNSSGGYYGYRMSKAALNAAGKSLALDLSPKGIAVAILHPGFVQTDMVDHAGDISADTAAERLAARIEALNADNSGTFWHSNGDILPW